MAATKKYAALKDDTEKSCAKKFDGKKAAAEKCDANNVASEKYEAKKAAAEKCQPQTHLPCYGFCFLEFTCISAHFLDIVQVTEAQVLPNPSNHPSACN